MVEKEILKGLNFAGLFRCSIAEAIHLVEIIVEEAKENRKELWVVLQDIKKAYNSVSIRTLRFALQRVKLPEQVIRFVVNLFQSKKVRVLTEFGQQKNLKQVMGSNKVKQFLL